MRDDHSERDTIPFEEAALSIMRKIKPRPEARAPGERTAYEGGIDWLWEEVYKTSGVTRFHVRGANMNKAMVVLTGLILLAGCSGGGDGGNSPPPAAQAPIDPNLTVPVQTALANFVNAGMDAPFTISGTKNDSTPANPIPPTQLAGTGRLTIGPAESGTASGGPFDGTTVLRHTTQVLTGTITGNGQSVPIGSTGQVYYDFTKYTAIASDSLGAFTLYDPYDYPVTVKAGDTGHLRNGRRYASAGDSILPETPFFRPRVVSAAYAVSSDTASTLLLRIIEDVGKPVIGGGTEQTQTVYRVDTNGNASLVSITTTKASSGSVLEILIFTF